MWGYTLTHSKSLCNRCSLFLESSLPSVVATRMCLIVIQLTGTITDQESQLLCSEICLCIHAKVMISTIWSYPMMLKMLEMLRQACSWEIKVHLTSCLWFKASPQPCQTSLAQHARWLPLALPSSPLLNVTLSSPRSSCTSQHI